MQTLRWSGVDSNFRFRARMATVPSLRALSIPVKLFGFRRVHRVPRNNRHAALLHLPQPAAEPGLAVALGGAGISLIDLVRLYAALSNAGEVAPLRYRPNDAAARGAAIFGPLAAWYVNDILAEAPPPGVLPVEVRRGRRLAFKTGASRMIRKLLKKQGRRRNRKFRGLSPLVRWREMDSKFRFLNSLERNGLRSA